MKRCPYHGTKLTHLCPECIRVALAGTKPVKKFRVELEDRNRLQINHLGQRVSLTAISGPLPMSTIYWD